MDKIVAILKGMSKSCHTCYKECGKTLEHTTINQVASRLDYEESRLVRLDKERRKKNA